jgi:flagella basal body P-ring formation protein FlgA
MPHLPARTAALSANRRAWRWALLVFWLVIGLGARFAAQAADAVPALDPALGQQVRQIALDAVRPGAAGVKRVEVAIGTLDPRLRLAPCQHVEPYLPNGVRLWGKAHIGLRCTQGVAAWNVFLPITVKAFGRALVASAALPTGSVISAGDLVEAEVDLAEEPSMAVNDLQLAQGRTLTRNLLPGQSLRQAHLKARQWFAAGATVTVLAQGPGFSVSSTGEALTPGIEGQSARVKTDSGQVLVGMPIAENRMSLPL